MANIITAGNSTNGGTQITTDTSGTLNIVTGSGSGVTAMSIDASGNVSGVIKSGTVQASTSGTSIDFTGIPSTAKRITVMFNSVSLSGTAYVQVQLGAGSVDTSGYTGSVTILGQGGTGISTNLSAGFQTENHTYWTASSSRMGMMTLTLVGSNIWTANWVMGATNTGVTASAFGGGVKTLSGTLDRVRITTTNGTDTFDAGSINILYE